MRDWPHLNGDGHLLFLRGGKRTSKLWERERPGDEGEVSVKFVPAMLSVLKLRWNIKKRWQRLPFRHVGANEESWARCSLQKWNGAFIKQPQKGNWWKMEQTDRNLTDKVSLDENKFPCFFFFFFGLLSLSISNLNLHLHYFLIHFTLY